ncbi:MAG: hypothetical protein AAF720_14280 [Pseudomonadota bacterium]
MNYQLGVIAALLLSVAACGGDPEINQPQSGSEPLASASDTNKGSSKSGTKEQLRSFDAVDTKHVGKTWRNPDAKQLAMLYFQLKDELPPVEAMIEATLNRNTSITGLNRTEKVKTLSDKIMTEYRDAEGVEIIEFELGTHLDDYDPTYEEYRIALFRPGATQVFRDNGWQVGLRFANAAEAGLWKATPDEAKDIALATRGLSNTNRVLVKVKAEVIGAVSPRNRGQSHVGDIKTRILSYTVHTQDGLQQLATATF